MQWWDSIKTKVQSTVGRLSTKQKAMLALILILPAPLIGVSASFFLPTIGWFKNLAGDIEIGKVIWLGAKIWLVALPVLWLLLVDQGKLSLSKSSLRGIIAGFLTAIPVGGVIFATYYFAKDHLIDPDEARQLIEELGISSPAHFLIFASAMSLFNSLMEEYVWRWFVFTKCKVLVGAWPAIILSALFFTAHHVIIMWSLGSLVLVLLGSIGIFAGGVLWSWLYNKYNSIWPGWICHVAADTAVMWVGWWILIGGA